MPRYNYDGGRDFDLFENIEESRQNLIVVLVQLTVLHLSTILPIEN